jgi:hypothetical protein
MSAFPFTAIPTSDQPRLTLSSASAVPPAPDPASDRRVLDASLEALLSGVSPYKIAAALQCSLVSLCERFANEESIERVTTIRRGMKNILSVRIDGLRILAAGHLEALLRTETTTLSAPEARSTDLLRRACISILRFDPDARRRSRDEVDRGPRLEGETPRGTVEPPRLNRESARPSSGPPEGASPADPALADHDRTHHDGPTMAESEPVSSVDHEDSEKPEGLQAASSSEEPREASREEPGEEAREELDDRPP